MDEYPQMTTGGIVSKGGKGEVYPPTAKCGGYPQGAEAYIAIDSY